MLVETPSNLFVILCDWRGRVVWSSDLTGPLQVGDLSWAHLNDDSQDIAKAAHGRVVGLREMQTIQIQNKLGRHFRCWLWPLDSPEVAVCVLGMDVPAALSELTARELESLEYLSQGLEAREIAERMEISTSTVHTHLKTAREKLGLESLESLISCAAKYCYPRKASLFREAPVTPTAAKVRPTDGAA